MHDSESVWVATPSLYETLIHNTLPALTGALNLERLFYGSVKLGSLGSVTS